MMSYWFLDKLHRFLLPGPLRRIAMMRTYEHIVRYIIRQLNEEFDITLNVAAIAHKKSLP